MKNSDFLHADRHPRKYAFEQKEETELWHRVEPPTKFSKKVGLVGACLEGDCWEREGNFRGVAVFI